MVTQAVILAAGESKRMMPLTEKRHKSMLLVGGKPLINHILEPLRKLGIRKTIFIVGHGKDELITHVRRNFLDLNPVFVEQKERNGTAQAVFHAADFVEENFFLAVNGDILVEPKVFSDVLDRHKKTSAMIVTGKKVSEPKSYGVFEVEKDKLLKVWEKSPNPPSNIANAGVYVFPRKIFDAIMETPKSPRGEYEITDSINLLLEAGEPGHCVVCSGYWADLATPEDLMRANLELNKRVKV